MNILLATGCGISMNIRATVNTILIATLGINSLQLSAQEIPNYTTYPKFYEFLPNAVSDWVKPSSKMIEIALRSRV